MKLIYKGKFDGDENSLPQGNPVEGAVQFKEADDMNDFAKKVNLLAVVLLVAAFVAVGIRAAFADAKAISLWGYALAMLTLFPHELLHGICFREEVYLYTNWRQGMLFVTGTEHMTKARFIFMSLLPNLIFGFVPFLLFMVNPQWTALGTMGAMAISMGAGDYYNVWNALTQVPEGAVIYNQGFHSYWYIKGEK